MASKVPVNQEAKNETEKALATIPSTGVLMNIDPPEPAMDDLLPQFKIPYSIEVDGEKFKKNDAFCAGLFDGKGFRQLEVPYLLTVLAARKASRKLITKPQLDEAGNPALDKQGNPIETKDYERGFLALGDNSASDEVYKQHEVESKSGAKDAAQMGTSYVLAVIEGDKVAICEFPAFKLMINYLGRPLYQAMAQSRQALQVNLKDHDCNLTTSKNNVQWKYLDPGKFKQHLIVELTEDQARLIGEAIKASKSKFDAWIER